MNFRQKTVTSPSVFIGARRYPLSYILTGGFNWGVGTLVVQDSDGYWWSTMAVSVTNAYALGVVRNYYNPQSDNNQVNGFPLRCRTFTDTD